MSSGAAVGRVPTASDGRTRLRVLDACLFEFEEANERGENRVSAALAGRLRPHLPWLAPGMLLSDAIEAVFDDQSQFLRTDQADSDSEPLNGSAMASGPTELILDPIDAERARALTDRIKGEMHWVCVLLLEAHDRRAWLALGYPTWERYVREEFSLSRSRSYELLDQGRVVTRIQAAAGLGELPEISAYAAGEIKSMLPDVVDEIRRRLPEGGSPEVVRRIVSEVVKTTRHQLAATRVYRGPALEPSINSNGWASELAEVVAFLASLPAPAYAAAQLSQRDIERLAELDRAAKWLTDFAARFRPQRSIA